MHPLPVSVSGDHLQNLTRAQPINAVAELIWNSLDADATEVRVTLERNLLGASECLIVSDNGSGMSWKTAHDAFGSLGGSHKKSVLRTGRGRFPHGRLGKGRLKAFSLGAEVSWRSTHRERDGAPLMEVVLQGTATSQQISFNISDSELSTAERTGTAVTVTGIPRELDTVVSEACRDLLNAEFALYLRKYPDAKITVGAHLLDPAALELRQETFTLETTLQDGTSIKGTLEVIEWAPGTSVERGLYLCEPGGVTLWRAQANIPAPGFNYTAHVSSQLVRDAALEGTLELEGLHPVISTLVEQARDRLRQHFKEREAERGAELVESWKEEEVYPFENEATSPIEVARRQVFDIVALNVHRVSPQLSDADRPSKRLTFRLLRHALESDSGALQRILSEVFDLPKTKQEELAKLLERTSLASLISAATLVANRLDFLKGLEQLVHEPDLRKRTKERTQLHRIVAEHTWLFGEDLHLAGNDESLTTIVRRTCARDGIDILDPRRAPGPTASRSILDLMLARTLGRGASPRRHHLVVELKRPSVKIDLEAVTQVERYAGSLMKNPAFPAEHSTWEFWALSTERHDELDLREFPQPLQGGRGKLCVRTWGEVIRDCEARLHFFEEQLRLSASYDSGMAYLREAHGQYVPTPDEGSTGGEVPAKSTRRKKPAATRA